MGLRWAGRFHLLAHTTQASGTSWSLARWATMNCETIGRQATSRELSDPLGEGARFNVAERTSE
jgi:hypothetical protein